MISAVTGEITEVEDDRAHVRSGPFVFQLLVPASDVEQLRERRGSEATFHTLLYLEGDPNRGNLEPRMIGFARERDRQFFELFTTVKGIGPKTALRALGEPVDAIAAAIERRDVRFLVGLDGIGKRTAELIVAELSGKAAKFVTPGTIDAPLPTRRAGPALGREELDAVDLLIASGERREAAEQLLARAKTANPDLKKTEDLWREMLRMRG